MTTGCTAFSSCPVRESKRMPGLRPAPYLDITPTIFILWDSRSGKIWRDRLYLRLDSSVPQSASNEVISTYESLYRKAHDGSDTLQPDRDLDEELIERLRSLGYIK